MQVECLYHVLSSAEHNYMYLFIGLVPQIRIVQKKTNVKGREFENHVL